MKIVICGAGDVGVHLARKLSLANHHITVIDRSEKQLSHCESVAEVLTVDGSCTSFATLARAEVSTADLLLAVTSNEDVNILAAAIGRKMGARATLARVNNDEFVSPNPPVDLRDLGVDHIIYPEGLAAQEIVKLIQRAAATDIHEFEDGKLTLMGIKLGDKAEFLNNAIQQVMKTVQNVRFRIAVVKRAEETIIPSRDIVLQAGDQLIVIANRDGVSRILELSGKSRTEFRNIMILGGGKIGRATAELLERDYNVKLIEADLKRAYELADQLKHTLILQGDGRNADMLIEEGVSETDAFIAVTEDAETNIIASLLAREMGVKKTIAYVENAEYNQLTNKIGLNALINKKIIAANDITRLVRKTQIVALTHIHGMDAEVLEYVVPEGARVTKKPVRKLRFPRGAIMGGLVRGEHVEIVVGDTEIQAHDRVVVFTLPEAIEAVERFFHA